MIRARSVLLMQRLSCLAAPAWELNTQPQLTHRECRKKRTVQVVCKGLRQSEPLEAVCVLGPEHLEPCSLPAIQQGQAHALACSAAKTWLCVPVRARESRRTCMANLRDLKSHSGPCWNQGIYALQQSTCGTVPRSVGRDSSPGRCAGVMLAAPRGFGCASSTW